jgi:hypothetical protein
VSIDPIEALWITTNAVALVFTAIALWDAWRDRGLAPRGTARRLVARGNVRREFLRLVCQSLLMSIIVPGLSSSRPTPVTLVVAALVAVPIVLLVSSIFDWFDRRALLRIVVADVAKERSTDFTELAKLLRENTRLTKHAGDKADLAYREANTVNQKIDARTHAIARGESVDEGGS